jgi:dipeptidase
VPETFAPRGADGNTFSWDNAWWIFNWVSNMVYPRYSLMIDDIRVGQQETEGYYRQIQAAIEAEAVKRYAADPKEATAFLTDYTLQAARNTTAYWKQLGEYLIVKYNDQVQHREKDGRFEYDKNGRQAAPIRPGFPKAFLEKYVEATGDRYKAPAE